MHRFPKSPILAALLALITSSNAVSLNGVIAAEGGASNYVPGAYGNFGVAIAPEPGIYFQNDFFLYSADASVAPLSNATASLDTTIRLNMSTGLWAPDIQVLGAQYAAGIVVPYLGADLSGQVVVGPLGLSGSASDSGLGDIAFVPASLFWTVNPNFHVNLYSSVVAPTGDFTSSKLLNLGRNYWSFDTVLATTYMTATGTEFSMAAGLMVNSENPDTNYRTGNEFHLDWMVNQFLSETFAIGVQGYHYRQISGDSGSGARLGSFKGEASGIGGAIMWVPVIHETPVKVVAKFMHEFNVKRRLKGNWGQVQFAFQF